MDASQAFCIFSAMKRLQVSNKHLYWLEETVNHILIRCIVAKVLWDMICALFGVQWVFPETVKEVLLSWRGPFVGEKRKKIWKSIPLYIFWTLWKERNRLTFRGG